MTNIIIKDKNFRFGKTRSEQAVNLLKEGWGTSFKSEEALDKCKFLERKTGIPFPLGGDIDRVK